MREIEFRGKAIHPNSLEQIVGSWAYGGIFENKIISRNLDMDSHYHGFISEIEVDIKTIGQYTGLKDKNGKKIFEGDIVINSKGQIGYIAFLIQEAGFVVVLNNSDYRLGHRNTNECYERATHHKIIGNIHENPELLEVAE
ncbi:hypothetical protein LL50_05380 [Listeria monocytogenes]|nr:hypothetical protein [Listeria monocytogenes]EAD0383112.1 hypothetical protein [Listeria monocytogenes]EAF2023455.1 hypothetical protein [Listeria monocytogenes]